MKFKIDLRYIGNCACDLFKENAKTLAVIAVCWLIGLAVGVAVSVKIEDYAALNILEALKDGSYSASGTFFRCLALGAVGAAAAYLTAFKRQLAAISAVWTVYLGYRFGMLAVGSCNVALATGLVSLILFCLPCAVSAIFLISCTIGATSGCRLAKNAAMTCRKPLTDALIKTAILLGAYALVLIVFCVILPKLIALLFL